MQPRRDVLMVIKTDGLEYDDRLQKEVESISHELSIAVSCMERGRNEAVRQWLYPGVESVTHRVHARAMFRPGRGVVFKAIESVLRFSWDIVRQRPRTVWVHNPDLVGVILVAIILRSMCRVDRVVWDLHELPTERQLKRSGWMLRWALKRVDCVIHTNWSRSKYLERVLGVSPKDTRFVENYADGRIRKYRNQPLPTNVQQWLGSDGYVLAQGGGRKERYHKELVEACSMNSLKLIIIGNCNERSSQPHVLYTGQIPQAEVYPYIDGCICSVVLYDSTEPNLRFCSPNRLYQAAALGKPVLVGRNPPMRKYVHTTGGGVILNGDGRDIRDVAGGLEEVLANVDELTRCARENSSKFTWQTQEEGLREAARWGVALRNDKKRQCGV